MHEQDVTQGQFLRGVKRVWTQIFYSPRLFVKSKQKKQKHNSQIFTHNWK